MSERLPRWRDDDIVIQMISISRARSAQRGAVDGLRGAICAREYDESYECSRV